MKKPIKIPSRVSFGNLFSGGHSYTPVGNTSFSSNDIIRLQINRKDKTFSLKKLIKMEDIRTPERVPGQGKYRTFAIVQKQRRFWFFKWWYGKVRAFVKGIRPKDQ